MLTNTITYYHYELWNLSIGWEGSGEMRDAAEREKKSWDSFTETKGNEVIGRLWERQKVVNWFILYCGTVRKETSVLQ